MDQWYTSDWNGVCICTPQKHIRSLQWFCSWVGNSMLITIESCLSTVQVNCMIRYQFSHNSCVIMGTLTSQITGFSVVYSIVCSGTDQRKYQSSESLAFVRGIHWWPVNSPHKAPVMWKKFPLDDVVMVWLPNVGDSLFVSSIRKPYAFFFNLILVNAFIISPFVILSPSVLHHSWFWISEGLSRNNLPTYIYSLIGWIFISHVIFYCCLHDQNNSYWSCVAKYLTVSHRFNSIP